MVRKMFNAKLRVDLLRSMNGTCYFDRVIAEIVDFCQLISRWCLGGYFLFNGLNYYLKIWDIPKPTEDLKQFLDQITRVTPIWLAIKWSQIIFGFLLVIGFALGLALVVFGVLVFGITSVQWYLNKNKRFSVLLGIGYAIFALLHWEDLADMLLP
ncbi:MAG: DoxX family membrane protein [Bdellovibrionaceae bacterium]|nr:DoxX family membrane protein [Pseudobdellovibrionaceae bacterium]MDW8190036.1 DoxX family membrane protein [Pseudobdellovibrionaceae bacterium]